MLRGINITPEMICQDQDPGLGHHVEISFSHINSRHLSHSVWGQFYLL